MRGILFMLAGTFFMSINNAVLKLLSAGYPAGQVLFMRGSFIFIPIAFFIWREGGFRSACVESYQGHALRAAFTIASAFMFVIGVRHLPLADATAISFAGPLFITMLATPILGEYVGWRRWSAVIVGFIGVLIITRPTGDVMRLAVLLPLGSAFAAAMRDLITRRIAPRETSNSILVTTTAAVALAGLLTLPLGWIMPTPADLGLTAMGGIVSGFGHYCMIETFRHAEAGLVAPFKYSSIVYAVGMGYLFWGDLPDAWVIAGTMILVASGLYILRREMTRQHGSGD
jgi:drug/metabolite transporter (DMT)-like permease